MSNSFKYDVAFSLMTRDEPLISQIDSLIKDRLRTFFYTERQLELAGTDGERTFAEVFRSDSRVVVIAFRPEWGSTKWTRIEETAIRARGHDSGYDFALLINLEPQSPPPVWFPPQRIWLDIQRLGINGAAAVIEQRLRELGSAIKQESPEEAAERAKRDIQFARHRTAYLESNKALADANAEVQSLFRFVGHLAETLHDPKGGLSFVTEKDRDSITVRSSGFILRFIWDNGASNVLHNAGLTLRVYEKDRDIFQRHGTPSLLEEALFRFDIIPPDQLGWVPRDHREQYFTSERLSDVSFKRFLDRIRKFELRDDR